MLRGTRLTQTACFFGSRPCDVDRFVAAVEHVRSVEAIEAEGKPKTVRRQQCADRNEMLASLDVRCERMWWEPGQLRTAC